MARDIMYYFDKKSPYARHELGEIQTNFNFGLTIDGSKDSAQVQVFSFNVQVSAIFNDETASSFL